MYTYISTYTVYMSIFPICLIICISYMLVAISMENYGSCHLPLWPTDEIRWNVWRLMSEYYELDFHISTQLLRKLELKGKRLSHQCILSYRKACKKILWIWVLVSFVIYKWLFDICGQKHKAQVNLKVKDWENSMLIQFQWWRNGDFPHKGPSNAERKRNFHVTASSFIITVYTIKPRI